jgi:hypothetical protein
MNRRAIASIAAAALFAASSPAFPAGEPKSRFTFTDAAGDVVGPEDGPAPLDIVGVDLFSDGEFIVVDVTLNAAPKPVSIFDALVAGVVFDVDNDPKSGGQGFAGMYGNVPGFEFESEIVASVEDGAVSKSASASVIGIEPNGNQSSVLRSFDAPATPAKGKTYSGKIAYSSLGAKKGQTIRVIVRELSDQGEQAGMFPEALLTLK